MKISRVFPSELPSGEVEFLTKDSFFASPGFLSLWRVRGGVPVYWTARHDDALIAALPGVEFGRGTLKRFYSTPNGCYGRLCFGQDSSSEVKSEIAGMIISTIAGAGYIKIFLNDFYECFDPTQGFETREVRTRLVDISDPDWQPPRSQLRTEIRRAENEEVSLRPFDATRHFDQFLSLVEISERRLGTKQKYSRSFFRSLATLSETDERVRWVWCERDGRPVASNIFFVEGECLQSWQVYFDPSFSSLQATKLIKFATAREAASQGIRYLNLGASHPGAAGVEEFKRGWGGKEYGYRIYSRKSFLGQLL